MPLEESTLARLRSQAEQGDVILFTGAGFSVEAKDRSGKPLPSVRALKEELWQIALPGKAYDNNAALGDLYEIAVTARRTAVSDLLKSRFSVNPKELPPFYQLYFDFPWRRYYTLNVDDLEQAAASAFPLRRAIRTLSALNDKVTDSVRNARGYLEAIHLNGLAQPGNTLEVTFSETQYAQRISNQEPSYARCVTELASRPFVFVGTELNEVPLWQHMELRHRRNPQGRDFRPTSILVTPSLNAARAAKLADLRIEWFEGTADDFATEVLSPLSEQATRGFAFLGNYSETGVSKNLRLVSELAAERPDLATLYLMGEEPQWADLIQGRAVHRSHEDDLLQLAKSILKGDVRDTALAVVGTGGAGKSTTLMSLALKLSSEGHPVFWVDRDSDVPPSSIRRQVLASTLPSILAIDDADLYGTHLVRLLQDLVPNREGFLFMFAARSTKVDDLTDPVRNDKQLKVLESVVPPLSDGDIDALITVLDKHNRLGKLKGLGDRERRKVFESYAGRHLLVAMLEATSGDKFERKAESELEDLNGLSRFIYSVVCVATSLRHYLTKDEVLLSVGNDASEANIALDRLAARHLVIAYPPSYRYRARHRVIADLIVDRLRHTDELMDAVAGALFATAAKLSPGSYKIERQWRLVIRLINHELLLRLLNAKQAGQVYAQLENLPVLSSDYHYWLQRGSLEVEAGDLRLAENFLSQARSLAPEDDYRIETEYAYMLMRKAIESPTDTQALPTVEEALEMLDNAIVARGSADPHPFHVIGRQGLDWIRVTPQGVDEKRTLLERLILAVDRGLTIHRTDTTLAAVRAALQTAYLMTAVPSTRSPGPKY